MKNAILQNCLLFSCLFFFSCQNTPKEPSNLSKTNEIDALLIGNKGNTQNDVPTQKTIDGMTSAEISAKFGIDVWENLVYHGYYNVYSNSSNAEVLHGDFNIESESREKYTRRTGKDDEEYSYAKYTGQYENGQKNGTFRLHGTAWEYSCNAQIIFSAGKCTQGIFEGASYDCIRYEGKPSNCTFVGIEKLATDIDCDKMTLDNNSGGNSSNTGEQPTRHTTGQTVSLYATSSSALKPSSYASYNAQKAIDGDPTTPWVEGANGLGIGEWIKLEFSQPINVGTLKIVNGYNYTASDKVGERFYKNGRVQTAILEFSNGTRSRINLSDTNKWQSFDLGGIETQSIRITIESAYKGTSWDDVCISEIQIIPR